MKQALVVELDALRSKSGEMSPSELLAWAAANPESALYAEYARRGLWDDAEAATRARLQFARALIQRYRVRIIGNDNRQHWVRAMVSTTARRTRDGAPSYCVRATVLGEDERRAEFHRDCARALRSVVNRFPEVLSPRDIESLNAMAIRVEAVGVRLSAAGDATVEVAAAAAAQ